jgi:hypothetical protein
MARGRRGYGRHSHQPCVRADAAPGDDLSRRSESAVVGRGRERVLCAQRACGEDLADAELRHAGSQSSRRAAGHRALIVRQRRGLSRRAGRDSARAETRPLLVHGIFARHRPLRGQPGSKELRRPARQNSRVGRRRDRLRARSAKASSAWRPERGRLSPRVGRRNGNPRASVDGEQVRRHNPFDAALRNRKGIDASRTFRT